MFIIGSRMSQATCAGGYDGCGCCTDNSGAQRRATLRNTAHHVAAQKTRLQLPREASPTELSAQRVACNVQHATRNVLAYGVLHATTQRVAYNVLRAMRDARRATCRCAERSKSTMHRHAAGAGGAALHAALQAGPSRKPNATRATKPRTVRYDIRRSTDRSRSHARAVGRVRARASAQESRQ